MNENFRNQQYSVEHISIPCSTMYLGADLEAMMANIMIGTQMCYNMVPFLSDFMVVSGPSIIVNRASQNSNHFDSCGENGFTLLINARTSGEPRVEHDEDEELDDSLGKDEANQATSTDFVSPSLLYPR